MFLRLKFQSIALLMLSLLICQSSALASDLKIKLVRGGTWGGVNPFGLVQTDYVQGQIFVESMLDEKQEAEAKQMNRGYVSYGRSSGFGFSLGFGFGQSGVKIGKWDTNKSKIVRMGDQYIILYGNPDEMYLFQIIPHCLANKYLAAVRFSAMGRAITGNIYVSDHAVFATGSAARAMLSNQFNGGLIASNVFLEFRQSVEKVAGKKVSEFSYNDWDWVCTDEFRNQISSLKLPNTFNLLYVARQALSIEHIKPFKISVYNPDQAKLKNAPVYENEYQPKGQFRPGFLIDWDSYGWDKEQAQKKWGNPSPQVVELNMLIKMAEELLKK